LVHDESDDVPADSHNFLNRRRNCFSQLLKVRKACDIRDIEIHAAELLVPEPSPLDVEMTTAKLEKYESPGSDKISAEPIQAEGETLRYESINSLIVFVVRSNCLKSGRSLLLYPFTR
jgi:hypothetical protein